MKKVKISKLEYNNYLEFLHYKEAPMNVITLEKDYRGGHIHIAPNCCKNAVDVTITYKGHRLNKTFDTITEKIWYEEHTGSLLNQKVEYKLRLDWKPAETMEQAYDWAKLILDSLEILGSVPESDTNITMKPIFVEYKA